MKLPLKDVKTRGGYNRRQRFPPRRVQIPRPITTAANIPRTQNFRYVDKIEVLPSGALVDVYHFGANNMFKPDQKLIGHQPLRWDQISVFYKEYVVVGSKITVTSIGDRLNTVDSTPSVWGVYLDVNKIAPPEYTTLIEQGRGTYKLTNSSNSMGSQMCTSTFSLKNFFNIKDPADNFALYGAETNAAPAKTAYFCVYQQSLNGSQPSPGEYLIQIDYSVRFGGTKDLARS